MDIDTQHVSNLKSGSIQSFEYLYNKWSGKVYSFVMQISNRDIYLAEEIVQLVFIKVWEKHTELDPEKSFSSYLFTIAKNQITKIFQHRMYELLYQQHIQANDHPSDNNTEKELEYKLLNEYIDRLIDQLPPARKNIFIMSRRMHMTNKEIAENLSISEHTVESQLTKALSFMREHLNKQYNLCITVLFITLLS